MVAPSEIGILRNYVIIKSYKWQNWSIAGV